MNIPNLTGRVDPVVESTIRDLYQRLQTQTVETAQAVKSIPPGISIEEIIKALSAGGKNSLNVTGLPGVLGQPQNAKVTNNTSTPTPGNPQAQNGTLFIINNQLFYYMNGQAIAVESIATVLYDTHANRVANYPPGSYVKGTLFYETDRQVLYVDSGAVWLYATGLMEAIIASRPTDLGTNDPGFLFISTDWDVLYRWTGSLWVYVLGVYSDITANRPVSLGTNDAGFLFIDTTQKILERWTGSTWTIIGSTNTNLVLAFTIQAGAYTILATDFQVVSSNTGAATIDLMDATTVPGQVFTIDNASTSTSLVTLVPFAGQTIGGALNQFLTPGSSIIIASDGTNNWTILSMSLLGPWQSFIPSSVTNLSGITTDCAFIQLGKTITFRISIQGTVITNSTVTTFQVPWTSKSNNVSWGGIEFLVSTSSLTGCSFSVSGAIMSTQFGSITAGQVIRYTMVGVNETT